MLQITDVKTVQAICRLMKRGSQTASKKGSFAKIFLQFQPSKLTWTAVPDSVLVIGNTWGLEACASQVLQGPEAPHSSEGCSEHEHPRSKSSSILL